MYYVCELVRVGGVGVDYVCDFFVEGVGMGVFGVGVVEVIEVCVFVGDRLCGGEVCFVVGVIDG